jgi:hypothetical protein
MKKGQTLLEHNFEFSGRCMTKCYNNNSKLLQEEIKEHINFREYYSVWNPLSPSILLRKVKIKI